MFKCKQINIIHMRVYLEIQKRNLAMSHVPLFEERISFHVL